MQYLILKCFSPDSLPIHENTALELRKWLDSEVFKISAKHKPTKHKIYSKNKLYLILLPFDTGKDQYLHFLLYTVHTIQYVLTESIMAKRNFVILVKTYLSDSELTLISWKVLYGTWVEDWYGTCSFHTCSQYWEELINVHSFNMQQSFVGGNKVLQSLCYSTHLMEKHYFSK